MVQPYFCMTKGKGAAQTQGSTLWCLRPDITAHCGHLKEKYCLQHVAESTCSKPEIC